MPACWQHVLLPALTAGPWDKQFPMYLATQFVEDQNHETRLIVVVMLPHPPGEILAVLDGFIVRRKSVFKPGEAGGVSPHVKVKIFQHGNAGTGLIDLQAIAPDNLSYLWLPAI
jgi:hypothetical protein